MRIAGLAACLFTAHLACADAIDIDGPLTPVPQAGSANATAPRDLVMSERDTFEIRSDEHVQARVTAHVLAESGEVVATPLQPTPDGRPGFVMFLKFIHDSSRDGHFTTPETIQQGVEDAAKDFVTDSVEGKATLKPLKYESRRGCYTTLTDKRLLGVAQTKPNDFRYAAVGMIRVSDDTVLQFRLLVNDLASADFFHPLDYALRFCKPEPATQPAK